MQNNARLNQRVYTIIRNIPIVGAVFRIVNAYAYKGDDKCNHSVAPLSKWWNRILKKTSYIFLFVEIVTIYYGYDLSSMPWHAEDLILAVFPSILGFGIGAFALLFVMPESFLVFMNTNRKRLTIGPEIVPVDIAYPLIVFTFTLCWAALSKIFGNDFLYFFSIFFFFYGMAMTFELISFLFNSALLIQKISISEYVKNKKNAEREKLLNKWRKK